MNFMIRPSKSFLFDVLESKLKKLTGEVGLDAGSNNFKNRRMFKTTKYYGLDINLARLKEGLQKHTEKNTYGIWADLSNLDKLPASSIEVVVSTNTLYALPIAKRLKAIQNLSRLTAPHGYFLCDILLDDDFKKATDKLYTNFKQIKIIYYKNIISQMYEKIFERDGYLGSHPLAGSKPFRLFAWLISRLEYLSCHFKFLNKHVFIIASQQRDNLTKNEFNLSALSVIHKRIYNIKQLIEINKL